MLSERLFNIYLEITKPYKDKHNILHYFQGEFGMTLSGMMNALADIQRRGDLMLEGVRNNINHPPYFSIYSYFIDFSIAGK